MLKHEGCTRRKIIDDLDVDDFMNYAKIIERKFGPESAVVLLNEPEAAPKDSLMEKNRSLVSSKMFGLNSPEQDLHQLSQFGKFVNLSS